MEAQGSADGGTLPIQSRFALGFIVENAAEHLALGLDLIGRPDLVSERAAPILGLLAFGTEHLLKATWVSASLNRCGEMPTSKELSAVGHRIVPLHHLVVAEATQFMRERARPAICDLDVAFRWLAEDLQWIAESSDLLALLEVFDAYGYGRYVDFETLLTGEQPPDPRRDWEQAVAQVWRGPVADALARAETENDTSAWLGIHKDYDKESATMVRELLLRYFRSVSRWWWCGLLGEDPRIWSGCLQPFVTYRPRS